MKSVVEELYRGQVYPAEQIVPEGKEYKALHSKISLERAYIKQKLSQADGERFDEMESLYLSVNDEEVLAGFSYGLKLGLLLTTELFVKGGAT